MNAIQKKWFSVVALVVILTLVVPWAVLADNAVPDGDGATPIALHPLDLQNVCTGDTITQPVMVAISREGNYSNAQVFLKNSMAIVSILSTSGSGLSAKMDAEPASATITIPSNWDTASNGTMTDAVASTVTFVAGTTTGLFSGSVTYRAAGLQAKDSSVMNRDQALAVTANVINCNNAPEITVNNVTVEGDTLGGWKLVFSAIGSASDVEDVTPSVSCSPAIGSLLLLGENTVTCTATDTGGKTATDSGVVTVQDTVAPKFSDVPSSITEEATSAGGAYINYTHPTATDVVWGSVALSCDPPSGSQFPIGANEVTCTVTDGSDNTATAHFAVNVQDTQGPTLVGMPDDMTVEGNTLAGANVSFTAPTATDDVDPNPNVSCDYLPAGGFYPLGSTPVTCTATDGSDNTNSAKFFITVVDAKAPDISVSDITAEGNTLGGANVTYDAPTATDIVWGATDVTCDHSSGEFFSLGTTLVSCSSIDGSGNSANAMFNVTVKDTTAPDLEGMPADMMGVEGNTKGGAYVLYTDPTATDIVDSMPAVSCEPASGTKFELGMTTVTCTATDASKTSSSDTFTVTVVDTMDPTLDGYAG